MSQGHVVVTDPSGAPAQATVTFSGFPWNLGKLNSMSLQTNSAGVASFDLGAFLPTAGGSGIAHATSGFAVGQAPLTLDPWGNGQATIVLTANPSQATSTQLATIEQKVASTGWRVLAIIIVVAIVIGVIAYAANSLGFTGFAGKLKKAFRLTKESSETYV